MKLPPELYDRLPRFALHIRRIDHHQLARSQPLRRDKVQHFESVIRRRLVVFIIRHESTAEVR